MHPFFISIQQNRYTEMALKSWQRKAVAIAGMAFFTFLFCLPGSDLPEEGFFSRIPFFDKWVHMGIFCTIILLWSWAVQLFRYKELSILLLLAMIYGFVIEVVQYQFIPDRSFDLADVAADMAGGAVGLLLTRMLYKKIDPCRNRGRNQN